jgi:hypothetical protein
VGGYMRRKKAYGKQTCSIVSDIDKYASAREVWGSATCAVYTGMYVYSIQLASPTPATVLCIRICVFDTRWIQVNNVVDDITIKYTEYIY